MIAAVDKGIKVCIVADGKDCHSSKRSTVKRAAQREVMRLKGIELELKLSALLQKNPSHPEAEELAMAIEKSNKLASNVLPDDFTVQLSVTIDAINNESIQFKQANLQADPVIAIMSKQGLSDMIW